MKNCLWYFFKSSHILSNSLSDTVLIGFCTFPWMCVHSIPPISSVWSPLKYSLRHIAMEMQSTKFRQWEILQDEQPSVFVCLFKTYLKSCFRFTAKLRGRYRDFPHTPSPNTCIVSPIISIPSPEWYICYNWWTSTDTA